MDLSSTYSKVFIDVSDIGKCRDIETVARLMNVAISRATDQVFLHGKLPRRLYEPTGV